MRGSRRGFFAALLAPLVARFLPNPATVLDDINDGINPDWDGNFYPLSGTLDRLNSVTLECLNRSAIPDIIFTASPFYVHILENKKLYDDAGAIWCGRYVKPTGEKWRRLNSVMRWPEKAPRLPA